MTPDQKSITSLKALPPRSYKNIDLDRLAVYALCILENKKIPLYFDYVAVALFRLFPKKFSMASFSRYPDTNRINKAVRRLTDQTRKDWATGSVENGFNLTDLGREVGKQVDEILQKPELQGDSRPPVPTRSRGRSADVETAEIRNTETFKKWIAGEQINNHEFLAFLKATSYTPKPLLIEHLSRLKKAATTTDDKEILSFLESIEKKFNSLLK